MLHILQNLHTAFRLYDILTLAEGCGSMDIKRKTEVGNLTALVKLHTSHLQLLAFESFVIGLNNIGDVLHEHTILQGKSFFNDLLVIAIEVHIAPDVGQHTLGVVVHGHAGEVQVTIVLMGSVDLGQHTT